MFRFLQDFNYFSDRFSYTSRVVDPLGTRTLFFVKGNIWKQLRVALTPIFTSKRMREMFVLVDECGKNLANYFEERVSNQNEEIREIIGRYIYKFFKKRYKYCNLRICMNRGEKSGKLF